MTTILPKIVDHTTDGTHTLHDLTITSVRPIIAMASINCTAKESARSLTRAFFLYRTSKAAKTALPVMAFADSLARDAVWTGTCPVCRSGFETTR